MAIRSPEVTVPKLFLSHRFICCGTPSAALSERSESPTGRLYGQEAAIVARKSVEAQLCFQNYGCIDHARNLSRLVVEVEKLIRIQSTQSICSKMHSNQHSNKAQQRHHET